MQYEEYEDKGCRFGKGEKSKRTHKNAHPQMRIAFEGAVRGRHLPLVRVTGVEPARSPTRS